MVVVALLLARRAWVVAALLLTLRPAPAVVAGVEPAGCEAGADTDIELAEPFEPRPIGTPPPFMGASPAGVRFEAPVLSLGTEGWTAATAAAPLLLCCFFDPRS